MTLVDLSEEMLAVSRQLNPSVSTCGRYANAPSRAKLRCGLRARRHRLHDTEADLRQAVATAYEHCRVGGVAVLVPDNIAENFEPGTDYGGHDAPDGRGARYPRWSSDPDPDDTRTRAVTPSCSGGRWHGAGGARHARVRTVSAGAVAPGADGCRIPSPLRRRGDKRRPTAARGLCRYARYPASMMEYHHDHRVRPERPEPQPAWDA